jgi:hypothetical protein
VQHLRERWWPYVALLALGALGLLGFHIGWAILGGALLGVETLLELVRIKRRAPEVPTSWRVLGFYGEALGLGALAGIGVWACGAATRAVLL